MIGDWMLTLHPAGQAAVVVGYVALGSLLIRGGIAYGRHREVFAEDETLDPPVVGIVVLAWPLIVATAVVVAALAALGTFAQGRSDA